MKGNGKGRKSGGRGQSQRNLSFRSNNNSGPMNGARIVGWVLLGIFALAFLSAILKSGC